MSLEQFHYFVLANKIIILSTAYSLIISLSQLIKEHTSHSVQARPTMHCIRLVMIFIGLWACNQIPLQQNWYTGWLTQNLPTVPLHLYDSISCSLEFISHIRKLYWSTNLKTSVQHMHTHQIRPFRISRVRVGSGHGRGIRDY